MTYVGKARARPAGAPGMPARERLRAGSIPRLGRGAPGGSHFFRAPFRRSATASQSMTFHQALTYSGRRFW